MRRVALYPLVVILSAQTADEIARDIADLKSREKGVQDKAQKALIRIGEPALPAFVCEVS